MNNDLYLLIIISTAGVALIIICFILLQVRNQNRLLQKQKQLAATQLEHQKALLHAVITSQEAERERIGSDLHDEVGARLSSLRMLIEKQAAQQEKPEAVYASSMKHMIDDTIYKTRQIAHNLSPHISGRFGFYDAMHNLADHINLSGTISLSLTVCETGIEGSTAMALYRVLAELINNTIKHAQASGIHITISISDGTIQLHYHDDGIGFTHNAATIVKGMGWKNIESRLTMIHATWHIPQKNEKGFHLHISAPVKTPAEM